MADRWLRDPGTVELIEYYNKPEKREWSLLTS